MKIFIEEDKRFQDATGNSIVYKEVLGTTKKNVKEKTKLLARLNLFTQDSEFKKRKKQTVLVTIKQRKGDYIIGDVE